MVNISLLSPTQRLPFLKALLCNLAFIAQLRRNKPTIKPLDLADKNIVLPDWYEISDTPPAEDCVTKAQQYTQMKTILEHIVASLDKGQQFAHARLNRAAEENTLIQRLIEPLTKTLNQSYSTAPHGGLAQIINLLNNRTPNISASQLQQDTHPAFHSHSARAHKRMVAHRATDAVLATQAAVEVMWHTLAGRHYQPLSWDEHDVRTLANSAFIAKEIRALGDTLLDAGVHLIAPFSRHCYPKQTNQHTIAGVPITPIPHILDHLAFTDTPPRNTDIGDSLPAF